jgi:hypothetical protein
VTAIDSAFAEALRDRYLLERELGRGGMATVYLALDLRHRRHVAVKRLAPELATAVGVERFQREIRLAASLQHPHILPVHDSGEAAGSLWYTMPYVEGESLRDRLRRDGQLEVEEAVVIAREVADALDCAHVAGIVHRDIKPENILLSRGHAMVSDFGIAHAVHEAGQTLTQTGLVVGTPAYMSPEQAVSTGHLIDHRSDIYSLGCVLYEMLVGERPFAGVTPQAVIARRLLEPPPDPRLARPATPVALAAVITRSLAPAPEDRFATAGEFVAALRASTHGLMPPAARTAATAARPSRRLAWFVGATALLLAGLGAAWLTRRAPAHAPLDDSLLAVAPFDVLEPSLALWHEGLMDVFSRTLEGAGSLHTVSPAVIARRWDGRASHAAAMTLARATQAGRVLYGALIPAGQDSLRLTATLLDTRRQRIQAEFDLHGPRDRVDRLADSLTLAVLHALAPGTGLAPTTGSPVGTASAPALKAFLDGEQHFRRSEFDSALGAFRKAVTLDSGFAVAWHRLSQSLMWGDSTEDYRRLNPEIMAATFRAAGARGLSARDSLVLTADSVFWALTVPPQAFFEGWAPDRFWALHGRLFSTLELAHRRYPQDPEVVLALAEAGWQWGGVSGRPFEQTLAFYDQAIALDSAFTPSYPHAAFLALGLDDQARALRYVEAHLRWGPSASVRGVLWLMRALLTEGTTARERATRLLDSLPVYALSKAFGLLGLSVDSGEAVVRVIQAMAKRQPGDEGNQWYPYVARGARGHLREFVEASRRIPILHEWGGSFLAVVTPAETLWQYRSQWIRSADPARNLPAPYSEWLASRGDTTMLTRLVAMDRRGSLDEAVDRAYLALGRRDTAEAVARFLRLPDSTIVTWQNARLAKARLLRATGHLAEAARTLRPTLSPWGSDYYPADGFWQLERGRTNQLLGDTVAARQGYRNVLALWRHADPELQPLVSEAREALTRLGMSRQ